MDPNEIENSNEESKEEPSLLKNKKKQTVKTKLDKTTDIFKELQQMQLEMNDELNPVEEKFSTDSVYKPGPPVLT